jgi:L-threonylcarbamoyladenylate synthase
LSRIVRVDPLAPDPRLVAEAAGVLRAGGLLGLPTETVYGLGARAFDERAVRRVFEVKGRPSHHPLIAHVKGEEQARALAADWPDRASLLAKAFWPGPLTLVVERATHVAAAVAGGGPSIAVRAPSHPVARAVIAALGEPVAAPSANRYGCLSPTSAAHVAKQLGNAVDLVLDAGPCEAGIESTVVDVRGPVARVLRPGAISVAALRAWAPEIEGDPGGGIPESSQATRASPGMGAHHYAPRALLRIAPTWDEAVAVAQEVASGGRRVGLLGLDTREWAVVVRTPERSEGADKNLSGVRTPERSEGADKNLSGILVRILPDDPAGYARLLYRALHELDDAGVDAIVVQAVPAEEAWWAVADRLRRAETKD